MNKQDIHNLVRWSADVELKQFAEDAYGITGTAFDVVNGNDTYGEYIELTEKISFMRSNFIMWIASLSWGNMERLSGAINKKENK